MSFTEYKVEKIYTQDKLLDQLEIHFIENLTPSIFLSYRKLQKYKFYSTNAIFETCYPGLFKKIIDTFNKFDYNFLFLTNHFANRIFLDNKNTIIYDPRLQNLKESQNIYIFNIQLFEELNNPYPNTLSFYYTDIDTALK